MKTINISDVVSQGWELFKQHALIILVFIIVTYFASTIVSQVAQTIIALMGYNNYLAEHFAELLNSRHPNLEHFLDMLKDMAPMILTLSFIQSIPGILIGVGLTQTLLNMAQGKTEWSMDVFKQPIMVYVLFFVTNIIVDIVSSVGFCLCFLPGFYLYARLMFATYHIVDRKEENLLNALSASWNMTTSSAFTLCGLLLLYILFCLIGYLCCCIGIIVPAILIPFINVVCYLTLRDDTTDNE